MNQLSKQQAYAELWRRGETSFLLHAGQQKLQDAFQASKHRVFAVECSRQLGKTWWGVRLADLVARLNPNCQIRIATAWYTDLKSIVRPKFREILETCPPSLRPKYRSQDAIYIYPNGSEIQLVGLDRNPNKLRGNRLRLVIIEEAGFTDSENLATIWKEVILPSFTHESQAKVVLISTPPESGYDHEFCRLADEAALEDSYVKLTIYDNPLLTPAGIEKIAKDCGGKESITFRREYLCERIIDDTRAIVPEFREANHVLTSPKDKFFPHLDKYESLDYGTSDKTVVLLGYYDFNRAKLVVEDEIILSGQEVLSRTIADKIKTKEQELGYQQIYRRISDTDSRITTQDLGSEHGVYFTPTDKDVVEAMVNKVRLWFQDQRVEIHPRCKFLIGSLKAGIWDKKREKFGRSTAFGHCDAIASLMYLIRNIDTYRNPIPTWLSTPPDAWKPLNQQKSNQLSQTGQDLATLFGSGLKR